MTSQIPTLKQSVNNVLRILQSAFKPNDDSDGKTPLTPLEAKLRRDNDYIQAFAIGSAINGLYKYLRDFIAKQSCPLTATGIFLKLWGKLYDVYLKEPSATRGPALITGVNDTFIPIDTVILRTSDNWEYRTDADATIVDGEAVVMLTAIKGGVAGNSPEGTELVMPTPIPGVTSIVVTTDDTYTQGLQLGTDEEKEEDFRGRIIFRIQNPPHGGAPSDYELWAMEIPGVVKAWCERKPEGPGTVGLRWMMNDDNGFGGFPTEADQDLLEAYITHPDRGPAADDLYLYLLEPNEVDVTITGLTPNTPAVRAAIKKELQDLFFRSRYPAATIPLSKFSEAISIADGEEDHTLDAPVAAPTAGADEINILGVLTINGVVVP